MTAVDRLTNLHSASRPRPTLPRSNRRATAFQGINLMEAYRAGTEILAGTAAFPPVSRPRQWYPIRCDQCPDTWLIGDSQPQAQTRLTNHTQQSHP
jgi:hypothetical protein